jgi:hypothetical protein
LCYRQQAALLEAYKAWQALNTRLPEVDAHSLDGEIVKALNEEQEKSSYALKALIAKYNAKHVDSPLSIDSLEVIQLKNIVEVQEKHVAELQLQVQQSIKARNPSSRPRVIRPPSQTQEQLDAQQALMDQQQAELEAQQLEIFQQKQESAELAQEAELRYKMAQEIEKKLEAEKKEVEKLMSEAKEQKQRATVAQTRLKNKFGGDAVEEAMGLFTNTRRARSDLIRQTAHILS